MARKTVRPELHRINRDGTSLAFTDDGSGPCIVLGHSFLCSRSMWTNQLPSLVDRYRVINVDYRGHGASGQITKPLTVYDLVSDVLAVLDDRGVERAVWAGLSVGGFVALRAAVTAPDRVVGLILLDTDAGSERWWPRFKYGILGAIARRFGLEMVQGAAVKQMFGASTRRTRPELVATWRGEFLSMDVPSLLYFLDALRNRDDIRPRLGAVAVPALVAAGTEDVSLPPERSRALAAALPHAKLLEIPEAGHLSALEQPAVVTEAMLDFLESCVKEA